MPECVGFHEIVPDQQYSEAWKTVVINTGASQSTLQDIKVPEYGGGYVYKGDSPATTNRYIFWRVADDTVQLWEESLNLDLTHNLIQLRIVGLPVLEGISVCERNGQHVVILISTIASTHCFTLPHPDTIMQHGSGSGAVSSLSFPSVLRDLEQHNLREVHSMHLLASPAVEGGRVHTASSSVLHGTAVFMFGQPSAALMLLTMPTAPQPIAIGSSSNTSPADVFLIKNTSLVNRLFMGFVPGMFRGGEGSDVIHSISSVSLTPAKESNAQVVGVGVCGDGRLRVWCTARRECVLIHDTLEDTAEAAYRNTPTGDRHVLVCRSSSSSSAIVAVRLSFVEKQLLLLYRLHLTAAVNGAATAAGGSAPSVALTHMRTLYPPQHQLVDMSLTNSHVWTLWIDSNNDNKLLYSSLDDKNDSLRRGPMPPSSSSHWGLHAAIAPLSPQREGGCVPHSDPSLDPREVYLRQLFQPYSFSAHTINRALAMYRGSSSATTSSAVGGASLRSQVEAVLQTHMETKMSPDSTEDELYDLTLDTYESFYSHTLQYHQVGQKGLGLACGSSNDNCGGVAVVRKQTVSWVAAVDAVEAVVAAAPSVMTPSGGNAPLGAEDLTQVVARCGSSCILRGDTVTASSVAGVLRCVALVRSLIGAEVAAAFMLDMAHHSHPEVVAEDVTTSLLAQVVGGDEAANVISSAVCGVHNFTNGLRLLVQALHFDSSTSPVSPDALHEALNNTGAGNDSSNDMDHSGALRGTKKNDAKSSIKENNRGQLWCSLVSASLHHLATTRLQLCRDLLVLQQLALRLAQRCQLSPDSVGQLRVSIVQDTVLVTRAYHALLSLTRAPAIQPTQQQLHSIKRVLAALALQDSVATSAAALGPVGQSTALYAVLRQGACPEVIGASQPWVSEALQCVQRITRCAWPLQDRSGSTALLESLVFGGQSEAALHYIRQVCVWCEWSVFSRHFLQGVCLVLQGQYRKAARLLQEAGQGTATEELLGERVGGGGPPHSARVTYTLRLVRLCEVFQQPSLAIRLASSALSVIGLHASDPPEESSSSNHLSQLYAVLFKHHLALGHHDEAFTSLLANPDSGSQKACLRQLLVTLHQRRSLRTLVNYQYGSLMPHVVTILENRARSADIMLNNHYDLLYAFHVHKHNYQRAASAMYECALRLSTEAHSSQEALKQQFKCYLACINCLKLLPKDMAWIVKPTPPGDVNNSSSNEDDATNAITGVGGGSKRCVAGERVCRSSSKQQRRITAAVQVLELKHLDREYQLVHARLQLLNSSASSGASHAPAPGGSDASSTVALLCHGKLYRDAARISRLFSLSVTPVLQSLAAACVIADNSCSGGSNDRLQHEAWLSLNARDSVGGDWWDLLRDLMASSDCGNGGSSVQHSAVTATLLDRGHTMPPWLLDQYTERDCGGLVRLMLRYGRLEEAANLALRLMDAVTTGANCSQVGLSSAVHVTSDPVWLPYTAIDTLLLELRENSNHDYYNKVLQQLESKIRTYQTELTRVSLDKVTLLQR